MDVSVEAKPTRTLAASVDTSRAARIGSAARLVGSAAQAR
jgi:hypothetical protein